MKRYICFILIVNLILLCSCNLTNRQLTREPVTGIQDLYEDINVFVDDKAMERETTTVEAESETTEPETTTVKPEPVTTENETTEPETTTVKPEPVTTENETTEPETTKHKHAWDSGKVSVEATLNSEGVYTYTCKSCGATKNETLEKLEPAVKYGNPYYILTSNNPDNYVEFLIEGNILTVRGKIIRENLNAVWVRCNSDGKSVKVNSGEYFSVSSNLDNVTDKASISVYTKVDGEEVYRSYIWDCIFVEHTEGEYIIAESMVLGHNLEVVSKKIEPDECMTDNNISEEVKKLAQEIVGDEKDDYRKLFLINKWIAENIYYDYDYYNNRDNEIYYKTEDVLNHRRSVCEGYANLQQSLILGLGIPCIKVVTYSMGIDTTGYFDENNYQIAKANHAHVEAYVNGRWVCMDATWDSNNKYENGAYVYIAPTFRYFDVTLEYFSYTHKIIERNVK